MNTINVVIGILFLVCVLVSWAKGLFKSILSVAGLIASIGIAVYAAPHLCGYIEEHTEIDEKIADYIEKKLEYSDMGEGLSKGVQIAVINELPLPESLKSNIRDNNNSEMYDLLDASGVYDYIAKSVAVVILNAAIFLILTILSRLFFYMLSRNLSDFTKLPIVRFIDKIGGGCLGALKGIIYIWVFFMILSICSTLEWSQSFIAQINDSAILK
ncbi:MAG: CvpA family protein, partial [Lachnospiraceae bacterium]|nr:CvpA family protein [Lachnospiraceae bacterium]